MWKRFSRAWANGRQDAGEYNPNVTDDYTITSNVEISTNTLTCNLQTIREAFRSFDIPRGVWLEAHCKGKLRYRVVGLGTSMTLEAEDYLGIPK